MGTSKKKNKTKYLWLTETQKMQTINIYNVNKKQCKTIKPKRIHYDALLSAVKELYPKKDVKKIMYKDVDEDFITISSNEELIVYLKQFLKEKDEKNLSFYVKFTKFKKEKKKKYAESSSEEKLSSSSSSSSSSSDDDSCRKKKLIKKELKKIKRKEKRKNKKRPCFIEKKLEKLKEFKKNSKEKKEVDELIFLVRSLLKIDEKKQRRKNGRKN